MPTVTLIGMCFILLGSMFVAFTPREKIIHVVGSNPHYDTVIAVMNIEASEATAVSVPYGETGRVLEWDDDRKVYKWVARPSLKEPNR